VLDKISLGPSETEAWYVVKLKPHGLARAMKNLRRQGYCSFMPKRLVSERRAGKIKPATRPLFPGYLFVQIAKDRPDWRSINCTFGVVRLVTLDGKNPSQIPAHFMAALLARCDGDIWNPDSVAFAPGTAVRMVSGPFANTLASIDSLPEPDRVYVLLDMMGRAVRAKVTIQDLERI
jgi:transcriptional antiterminator RfaH